MNGSSRITNSTRNILYGFISQLIVLFLNFIVRIIFIRYLGETYLGVNGLFSNILSVLSLAEMGFGTAITYNLYKPLANNDIEEIKSLMHFYAKIYKIIGFFVFLVGLVILPFLDYIINNDSGIDNIYILYLLFLADSALSYFFAYKRSILNADQKVYICSKYRYIFVSIKRVVQILFILLFKNFIIYLLTQIVFTFLENLFISMKVNSIYPYLKLNNIKKLSQEKIKSITADVKALVLSKIANVALNGTDNIIITAFTDLKNVGILSNYTLISGSLTMIISQIYSAITGSLGNFIALENNERKADLFYIIDFMYFIIYGFCFICMFIIYNPFISYFFGKNLIFSNSIVFVFCINYLIEGMLQSFWSFRTTMGLFVQGKYRPLIAAVLNVLLSVILGMKLGVFGVLLGTTFSRLFVNAWYDPYIIFKHGLSCSPKRYYFTYIFRLIHLFIITAILFSIKLFFFSDCYNSLFDLLLLIGITVVVSISLLIIPYVRSNEFKFFLNLIINAYRNKFHISTK